MNIITVLNAYKSMMDAYQLPQLAEKNSTQHSQTDNSAFPHTRLDFSLKGAANKVLPFNTNNVKS